MAVHGVVPIAGSKSQCVTRCVCVCVCAGGSCEENDDDEVQDEEAHSVRW